jgi:hypothetical protein
VIVVEIADGAVIVAEIAGEVVIAAAGIDETDAR